MEEMIEKAKEELEILETLHPHRFHYIKLELQSLISTLNSQLSLPCSSTATTQGSSTSMKRKRVIRWKIRDENGCKKKKGKECKDRVDAVLDKANACLHKIQDFKFQLLQLVV